MLSNEEKREMLEDAQSQSRQKVFRQIRESIQQQPLTAQQYMAFLKSVQNLFPSTPVAHKIEGDNFRL